MKAPAPLRWLAGPWSPRPVPPPTPLAPSAPVDDIVITHALQIRRTLAELARLQRPVALQTVDGHLVARGEIRADGGQHLALRLYRGALPPSAALQWPLNATACSAGGMALFTLRSGELGAQGLSQAHWPEQLIHMQSRRHFRLTGLDGRRAAPGSAGLAPRPA